MIKCSKSFRIGYAIVLMRNNEIIDVVYNPPHPSTVEPEELKQMKVNYNKEVKILRQKRKALDGIEEDGVFSVRAGKFRVDGNDWFFIPSKRCDTDQ